MKFIFFLITLILTGNSIASVSECTAEKMQSSIKKALQRPLFDRFYEIQHEINSKLDYPWDAPNSIGLDSFEIVKVKDSSTTILSGAINATELFGQYFLVNYDSYEISFKICYNCKNEDFGRVYLYDSFDNFNEKVVEFTQPQIVNPDGNYPNVPNQPLCVVKARTKNNRSYEMSLVPSPHGYDNILEHEIYEPIVKVAKETPADCFEFRYGNIIRYKCEDLSDVIIPKKINNEPVTMIAVGLFGDGAFRNKGISSVVIPDSVTEIGSSAFANNRLTKIKIPNSVVTIGNGAFAQNELTEVEISNSVKELGSYAFIDNQLSHIKIPNTLKIIYAGTFENNKLTNIEIPDSVKVIDERAFFENQIADALFPKTLTEIRDAAFAHNKLSKVVVPANTILSVNMTGVQTSFDRSVVIQRK